MKNTVTERVRLTEILQRIPHADTRRLRGEVWSKMEDGS